MEQLSGIMTIPFSLVLEERKSIRGSMQVIPLRFEQFRRIPVPLSARIKELHKANPAAALRHDISRKPYREAERFTNWTYIFA
jgi:hypothetical protein